jgi:hypothetical protein
MGVHTLNNDNAQNAKTWFEIGYLILMKGV